MNDDDPPRTVEFASQRERDALGPWVARVLKALGHEEALVTDETRIGDFLSPFGDPGRWRRGRNGPWSDHPGDPAIREENARLLAQVTEDLGVPVGKGDLLIDVARRLRACGRA
jgi:hypothetical protein